MVHDYHLYTLPALVRRARPDAFLHHFVHIPWTQPDAWRVLPDAHPRARSTTGLLANDIIGFHTRAYRRNFLQCCRDLMGLEVDFERGRRAAAADREVWVRAYPLPIDAEATRARRGDASAHAEFERELLRRRREHLILRVDRADLSKNVLRGFTAFDLFLEQHPEFRERVTFIAQLMPSRTDVPEYAEYLERIEALVAVVNHRHGTPDWMPIQLKLRDDLEEAMAAYKHYDVLLVNAMFDGMNLVAKEGPLVNERNGVSILSENTGAHEELGEYALSVNPFDIQELADSIHAALTMSDAERARRADGLQARSSPRATPATGSTSSSPTSARRRGARAGRRRARRRAELAAVRGAGGARGRRARGRGARARAAGARARAGPCAAARRRRGVAPRARRPLRRRARLRGRPALGAGGPARRARRGARAAAPAPRRPAAPRPRPRRRRAGRAAARRRAARRRGQASDERRARASRGRPARRDVGPADAAQQCGPEASMPPIGAAGANSPPAISRAPSPMATPPSASTTSCSCSTPPRRRRAAREDPRRRRAR